MRGVGGEDVMNLQELDAGNADGNGEAHPTGVAMGVNLPLNLDEDTAQPWAQTEPERRGRMSGDALFAFL